MSNRYANNRQEGNRGFPRVQKQFVPKMPNSISREPTSNPTLSNSLRQTLSRQSSTGTGAAETSSGGVAGASTSRLQMGEKGDRISSKTRGGHFVNYLPQDEAVAAGLGADDGGLDPVESQSVVDVLNRALSRLLKLNSRDFWREVAMDTSLHAFLESFLKFRSRWYDFPYRGAKAIVAGVIVGEFELSRRAFMILYRISSNRDPGAKAADSLSAKDHSVLLQDKKLLDLPNLLDICAIYGQENEDLTSSLVVNAIKAQPWIHEDFTAVISRFLSIARTMNQRCNSSLEVLFSSHEHQENGSSRLQADCLEVMDFINDAIVSMDAFVTAYKPAVVFFCSPVEMSYGDEEVLITLASLHDSLLPSLQRGFQVIFDGSQEAFSDRFTNIMLGLHMLKMRIVKFGWNLLYFCHLSDEIFQESVPQPAATKIFPAKVEDPVIRTDILVQTFRQISAEYSHVDGGSSRLTFLRSMERNHKIMSRIQLLRTTGWIVMDDEQYQFLSGITSHSTEAKPETSHIPTPPASNTLQMDEDAAIIESKISQIKDLFPDHGKGFLSACLEVYNHNPEDVIQRILEGTLHEDLLSLDTSMEKIPPPKSAPPVNNRNDKGKAKVIESETSASANGPPLSSSSLAGRYVRKSSSDDLPESLTLDRRDEKDLARTAAFVSQLEYDDEYDDSFDDLGLSVADSGVEETEALGEKLNSSRGKTWESAPNAPSSSSKWGSRKKPQFYVKDGKNYSYKVEGSTAVANFNEASLVNQAQKEVIHGLGRGGNLPLGAVRKLAEANEVKEEEDGPDENEVGGQAEYSRGRGRRGGGGRNHNRRDRAMKKHFSGVTGY